MGRKRHTSGVRADTNSATEALLECIAVLSALGNHSSKTALVRLTLPVVYSVYYSAHSPFTAIACPLPSLRHVRTDVAEAVFRDDVVFACESGYTFPDGSVARTSQCGDDGGWLQTLPDCIGELSQLN